MSQGKCEWISVVILLALQYAKGNPLYTENPVYSSLCGNVLNLCACQANSSLFTIYIYQVHQTTSSIYLRLVGINFCCPTCCGYVNSPIYDPAYSLPAYVFEYKHEGCPDWSTPTLFAAPSNSTYLGCWYETANNIQPPTNNCPLLDPLAGNFIQPLPSCPAGSYSSISASGIVCVPCKTCSSYAISSGSCPMGSTFDGVICTCNSGYVGNGIVCSPQNSVLAPGTTITFRTLAGSPSATKKMQTVSAAKNTIVSSPQQTVNLGVTTASGVKSGQSTSKALLTSAKMLHASTTATLHTTPTAVAKLRTTTKATGKQHSTTSKPGTTPAAAPTTRTTTPRTTPRPTPPTTYVDTRRHRPGEEIPPRVFPRPLQR